MSSKLNEHPRSPVRLQDIADLAETSVATVSMALAGNTRVSPQTRQRIRDLSREVGYRPRRSVRVSLRRDAMNEQRFHFGFLALDRLDTPLNAVLFQDLTAAATKHEIRLEIAGVDRGAQPHELVDRAVQLGRTVDGLIIMGAIQLDQLQQIRQAGIPVVMYGYPLGASDEQDLPAPVITSDWQAMGHRATRTLIDRGHRRIGFVSGKLIRGMWHDRCLDGYLMAHAHAGLDVDRRCIFEIPAGPGVEATIATTHAAAARAQALDQPPTAYVLINLGNAERFRNAIGRVGFDLTPQNAVICGPPRTIDENALQDYPLVHMDPARMVEVALAQLRARCTNPTSPCTVVLVPFGCKTSPSELSVSNHDELALFGGPESVTKPPVENWRKVTQNVRDAVGRLMDRDIATIANGSGVVGEFETAFAKMAGAKHALAMNSGTSTLHAAYFAVGVGPGDQVLVPTYTWHATITPILHCAATPVFCDIDPATLTIDPDEIERKITARTKAICVVHVWGNVCDMDRILAIARRHSLVVIEDCSHAHGASWKGRRVGSMGAIGCFSCQGGKPVSGGELGVAVTDDPELYDRMVLLGHFGRTKIGKNQAIHGIGDMSLGAKYRPQAWAVAMANEDLKRLDELNEKRTRNYQRLNDGLRGCPGLELIEPLPGARRGGFLEFKYKLAPELLARVSRKTIVEAFQAEGVPLAADRYSSFNYTYGLLHTAPLFAQFDRRSIGGCFYDPEDRNAPLPDPHLPVAEDIAARLVSMYAYIDTDERFFDESIAGVRKVLENVDSLRAVATG